MPRRMCHCLAPSGSHKDWVSFWYMVEGNTSNKLQVGKSFKHMVEGDIPNFIRVEIEEGSKSGKECFRYLQYFLVTEHAPDLTKNRLRSLKKI